MPCNDASVGWYMAELWSVLCTSKSTIRDLLSRQFIDCIRLGLAMAA